MRYKVALQIMFIKFPLGKICLIESATTHIILRRQRYFMDLTLLRANINTVSGPTNLIENSGRATILLSNNTKLCINDI